MKKDKRTAIYIRANGITRKVSPKKGGKFSLQELQGFVGGYIEILNLHDLGYGDKLMVLNEEGKLMGLPYNEAATILYRNSVCWDGHDYIVGDVLLCDADMID